MNDQRAPWRCLLRPSAGASAALLIVLGSPTALSAQPDPARTTSVRAHLSVQAPENCVTYAALAERVRTRTKRIAWSDEAAPDAPVLRVTLLPRGTRGFSAELLVDWPGRRQAQRQLNAASCEAAADALALLIAWTLDPSTQSEPSATAPPPDPSARAKDGPHTPTETDSPERTTNAEQPANARAASTPATAEQANKPPHDARESEQAAAIASQPAPITAADGREHAAPVFGVTELTIGAGAQLTTGPAPRAMPGVGLTALLALHGSRVFLPALRLRAVHSWVSELAAPGGVADFQLDLVQLDACPIGARAWMLTARACLTANTGSLSARGSATYDPEAHARLWASLGGGVLLTADLGRVLQLQGGLGLLGPLRRDRFAFAPEVFHRVAGLCFEGQFVLALRFV